jgi:hypothetical protein
VITAIMLSSEHSILLFTRMNLSASFLIGVHLSTFDRQIF